jgi:hypothetical protein
MDDEEEDFGAKHIPEFTLGTRKYRFRPEGARKTRDPVQRFGADSRHAWRPLQG